MKIGIDASRAFLPRRTGIEEYSYQVIRHLADKLEGHEVFLYVRKCLPRLIACRTGNQAGRMSEIQKADWMPKNWKIKIIKWPRFWTQIGLSLEMLRNPTDVLFIPAHAIPMIHPKNTVVTVHGLEYEFFPRGYFFWERLHMRLSTKLSCRCAQKIIAVSKNTKKDLVELYKVPEEKIGVVYEGVCELAGRPANSKLKMLNSKPYLLFIGRLEKRKNIEGIISAFEMLKEKYKIPHKLVLAGKSGYGRENIKLQISNSKWRKDIFQIGYVSEEEKYDLLKNADIFLFPSFYEGFGLPILEAQSAGAPIVASNVSSIPEVGGEGAAYCDPGEPETIADAVEKILDGRDNKESLIKRGYENVKKFSWEKCAEETKRVILG